jgi:hypothetical protein
VLIWVNWRSAQTDVFTWIALLETFIFLLQYLHQSTYLKQGSANCLHMVDTSDLKRVSSAFSTKTATDASRPYLHFSCRRSSSTWMVWSWIQFLIRILTISQSDLDKNFILYNTLYRLTTILNLVALYEQANFFLFSSLKSTSCSGLKKAFYFWCKITHDPDPNTQKSISKSI